MKALYEALVKAQSQIKNAVKDSSNPHYRSKYADLGSVWEAIKQALHSNGLAVVQLTRIHESGAPVLVTRIIHVSGEHIEGEYPLVCKDPTDPQKLVAAMTYARRAALSAALGVIADDDDGNTASGIQQQATPVKAPAPAAKQGPASLFAAHGLEYPKALEDLIGKAIKDWTDQDKVIARQAVDSLNKGTPWAQVTKAAVFS